ncbi:MAG TPA: tetratricopeptide repeat protein [Pyrinomonadaceae bacterium]|nr:tetratricopeptide repeat protein [Pyrinomonadaceae bacterium]
MISMIGAACCAASLLSSCGNEPKLVSNQTAVANSNSQYNSAAKPAPESPASSATGKASMGEAIDTSEYDAKIKRMEEQAKKKPNDEATRKQLAQAYLERGNALTQARQYQAALGDYRRTLRYDPTNQEARYWSDTIIGIMKQMNRELPAEGAEPTPLKQ